MKKGLYIGRFQPLHKGHLSAIKQALSVVDHLIIGIGSSQYSHEIDNPLTGQEREDIIESALIAEKLQGRCEIFQIPDIHDNDNWTTHVRSLVPAFDRVFVGNAGIVGELFEKDNTPVHKVTEEVKISGSHIRTMAKQGQDWQGYVLEDTFKKLNELDFTERLI